jgi:hypothetical protein
LPYVGWAEKGGAGERVKAVGSKGLTPLPPEEEEGERNDAGSSVWGAEPRSCWAKSAGAWGMYWAPLDDDELLLPDE